MKKAIQRRLFYPNTSHDLVFANCPLGIIFDRIFFYSLYYDHCYF